MTNHLAPYLNHSKILEIAVWAIGIVKMKCYCKIFEYNSKLCHLKSDLNIKELNSSKYPVIK